jgi:hypothetical protein
VADELGKRSVSRHQLVVAAGIGHPTFVQYDDAVGGADGGGAVGDDQHRPRPAQLGEGLVDGQLV